MQSKACFIISAMHTDLNIAEIERNISAKWHLVNFDSSLLVGNQIFLFLGDELVGQESYKFFLSLGAQA